MSDPYVEVESEINDPRIQPYHYGTDSTGKNALRWSVRVGQPGQEGLATARDIRAGLGNKIPAHTISIDEDAAGVYLLCSKPEDAQAVLMKVLDRAAPQEPPSPQGSRWVQDMLDATPAKPEAQVPAGSVFLPSPHAEMIGKIQQELGLSPNGASNEDTRRALERLFVKAQTTEAYVQAGYQKGALTGQYNEGTQQGLWELVQGRELHQNLARALYELNQQGGMQTLYEGPKNLQDTISYVVKTWKPQADERAARAARSGPQQKL